MARMHRPIVRRNGIFMTPLVKRYLRNEFDKQNVPGDTTITRVDAIRVRGVERREIALASIQVPLLARASAQAGRMLDTVFSRAQHVCTAIAQPWTTLSFGKFARHRAGNGNSHRENICATSWTRTAHEAMGYASTRDNFARHPRARCARNT